jgi:Bacterial protein of unknown function (DUF853).
MVERAKILFPLSQIGAITEDQRATIIKQSRLWGRYDNPVDRESAYEILVAATQEAERQKAEIEAQKKAEKEAASRPRSRRNWTRKPPRRKRKSRRRPRTASPPRC